MTAPETSVPPASEPFPEGSVEAGVYATQAEGFEHGLVVLAMGEACWLVPAADGYHLRVAPAALDAVRGQLESFDRESLGWPPRPVAEPVPEGKRAPRSPWLWVLGVAAVFWAQGRWPGLTEAGWLDAGRVFAHGEWWRAVSALWLHADAGHLISNAGGGLLVFSAVVVTFGVERGWWLLTGAAIAGNLAAVTMHYGDDYRSLGASTAIFAGLGLLTGRAVRVMGRTAGPQRWRALAVPLASGLVVLGLFGAGGVEVDVLAHVTGFVAGLAMGFAAGDAAGGRGGATGRLESRA